MTKIHTLGITLLLAVSASSLAQDKAAPAAVPAKPAAAAPAAAPAPKPAAAPVAAPAAAATPAPAVAPAPTTKPAAAAAAATPAAAPVAKADTPKKKRVVKRKAKTACTKLDDPWDNVCQVEKNAQAACKDLPAGKKAAKAKSGKAPAVATENRRQQCVDNYMRNV